MSDQRFNFSQKFRDDVEALFGKESKSSEYANSGCAGVVRVMKGRLARPENVDVRPQIQGLIDRAVTELDDEFEGLYGVCEYVECGHWLRKCSLGTYACVACERTQHFTPEKVLHRT